MSDSVSTFLDPARLLVDLQRVSEIVQSLSGQFEPEIIAQQTTDRLIENFGCVFARIWLMEPDGQFLKLVASSGMYTHTDGFFARVPVGAFKVGKIAQNRIPFLSNRLADETWVKDRDWAIANQITGFAGYPLLVADRIIGVIAVFSRHALSNEFLEVLQWLCSTLAVLLENAIHYQQEKQYTQLLSQRPSALTQPLSEKLAELLQPTRLSLFGTERPLAYSLQLLLMRTAEMLQSMHCAYCRLNYGTDSVSLEAMLSLPQTSSHHQHGVTSAFRELLVSASCLGGTLQTTGVDQQVIQVVLTLPYTESASSQQVRISCQAALVQTALTHLAHQAGLTVSVLADPTVPLITDDLHRISESNFVLWVTATQQTPPRSALGKMLGKIDLSIRAEQLRQAVETVAQGKPWGQGNSSSPLSEREQEVLLLLTQGFRDRDVAQQLHISERTVKFHLNNVLTKFGARTRYQALYQAIHDGWLPELPCPGSSLSESPVEIDRE